MVLFIMDKLTRLLLIIEFDGQAYAGWQRQKNAFAVQQALEEALFKLESRKVQCVAAGRTDRGVHAQAMPVHVDVCSQRFIRSKQAYIHGLNQFLPSTIRVLACQSVDGNFHARFDCLERAYCYRIWNRNTASALHAWQHWWMPRELDLVQMNLAGQALLGKKDFSSFRASGCQAASAIREIRELTIEQHQAVIEIKVRADAFLYHMVRNIVGSLVRVGLGKCSVEQFVNIVKERDRQKAAATAPAHGLYFVDAKYKTFSALSVLQATYE